MAEAIPAYKSIVIRDWILAAKISPVPAAVYFSFSHGCWKISILKGHRQCHLVEKRNAAGVIPMADIKVAAGSMPIIATIENAGMNGVIYAALPRPMM